MTTTLALLLLLSSGAAQADLSEDPSDPASWVVEPTLPTLEDSEYGVTLDPPGGNRFYRLRRE